MNMRTVLNLETDPTKLNPGQIRECIEVLREEASRRTTRMAARSTIACLLMGLAILCALLTAHGLGLAWLYRNPTIFVSPFGFFALAYMFYPSQREREAASRIAVCDYEENEDPLITPALIEAMSVRHALIRRSVMAALTHRLAGLQPNDASLLKSEHRNELKDALKSCCSKAFGEYWSAGYSVAVLKAVMALEDTSFCPIVERLATMTGEDEKRRVIRTAAIECHEHLQTVLMDQQNRERLLRSVDQPHATDVLLRNAAHPGADAENLLTPIAELQMGTNLVVETNQSNELHR
jgi:hypothetical protein